ncbi:MAG: SelA-like pyridoxal phosphate-dependent enzyme [Chloroflexi bacterium]|nr:SelA-like pyridoxal phosphate-dependent enzyme [Chloroflexota bacterium]MDA1004337.1 SelA-like pyridoxal phosphate-dependent enzyme [Chloroflexota bacterium]
MSIYERFGVPTVINAAGKLTALGGTGQDDAVATAQADAARAHVDLALLRERAGALIAERCGAEAAMVTTGAAAGIALTVAACIAGADPERVQHLPDPDGWPNAVLLQAGHWVHFGAPVEQMIRLGGGRPVSFGSDDEVTDGDLTAALAAGETAAVMFVQSHHAKQERRLPLERCIALAHAQDVPVIVDAAAEEDLRRYVAIGADLVTYSGGKAFGGPTSGFVVGRSELIAACEAQGRGIGRPMKVGKEQIAGLLVALERYEQRDGTAEDERRGRVNAAITEALTGISGVYVTLRADEAGRPIERVAVSAVNGAFDVHALVRFLEAGDPSVRTRNHHLPEGIVLFDPREVTESQAEQIAARLRAFFTLTPRPAPSDAPLF